jgi:hypothetical protein
VEINDNPTKRPAYFRFCGNPLQRFELREVRKKLRLAYNLSMSEKRGNKQGLSSSVGCSLGIKGMDWQ